MKTQELLCLNEINLTSFPPNKKLNHKQNNKTVYRENEYQQNKKIASISSFINQDNKFTFAI